MLFRKKKKKTEQPETDEKAFSREGMKPDFLKIHFVLIYNLNKWINHFTKRRNKLIQECIASNYMDYQSFEIDFLKWEQERKSL